MTAARARGFAGALHVLKATQSAFGGVAFVEGYSFALRLGRRSKLRYRRYTGTHAAESCRCGRSAGDADSALLRTAGRWFVMEWTIQEAAAGGQKMFSFARKITDRELLTSRDVPLDAARHSLMSMTARYRQTGDADGVTWGRKTCR